jgi:hypothetical protein
MDVVLPGAVVATILSRLDVRSLVLAAAACRGLRTCASHALAILPSFNLLVRTPVTRALAFVSPSSQPQLTETNAIVVSVVWWLKEVALTLDMLRPLLPPNQSLRSLRLDCARMEDAAIVCLARPSLHELILLNCDSISGRLLGELGTTCRDLRYCMLFQFFVVM